VRLRDVRLDHEARVDERGRPHEAPHVRPVEGPVRAMGDGDHDGVCVAHDVVDRRGEARDEGIVDAHLGPTRAERGDEGLARAVALVVALLEVRVAEDRHAGAGERALLRGERLLHQLRHVERHLLVRGPRGRHAARPC
jgi:hypothetical protein